jgi:acetyl-CoA synthetase
METKHIAWVVKDPNVENHYWPSENMKKRAWVTDPKIYEEAKADPVVFWDKLARSGLHWFKDWTKTYEESTSPNKISWFIGGKTNISYNIVDRHKEEHKDKVAIYWEPEDLTKYQARSITYSQLFTLVNKFANVLTSIGVKKGDSVGIYLPMVPEVLISMIACTRIGAIHIVIFSAFSKLSLNERLIQGKVKVLITANGYYRRGKVIDLKGKADGGLINSSVEKVIVVNMVKMKTEMKEGRDLWWDELMDSAKDYCKPTEMDSEDPLLILYTSGTTGKPKGIVHHTGGYATCTYWTTKWIFDFHNDDVYFCTADIGWITGHTYNCYGPLLNAGTLIIYEGALNFPDFGRWWEIIEKYKVSIFYTSPTAIRMVKKQGDHIPDKYNLSTLRILATVGEPINESTWLWFFTVVGKSRCPIIDTWWQSETGSIMVNALPGIGPFIPGVAGHPFPGISIEILSELVAPGMIQEQGFLLVKSPYPPSFFRDINSEPGRYEKEFRIIGGIKKYFTNDGAIIFDPEGNIQLTGRMDDIMKVAGHALSTTELENVLAKHPFVAEAAVVPYPDEIKLEVPYAFVILKEGNKGTVELEGSLKKKVDELIGPIARPDKIIFVEDLPRTLSGKILRGTLRNLLRLQPIGDVTTLMNPDSITNIREVLGIPPSPRMGPQQANLEALKSPQKKMHTENQKQEI